MAWTPYPAGAAPARRNQWVYDQPIASPPAKAVLLALVHHDGPRGIFPSQARLACMTALGERTVRRELRWLARHGWIERARRHNRGHRTSDAFTIRLPATVAGGLPATVAREQGDSEQEDSLKQNQGL